MANTTPLSHSRAAAQPIANDQPPPPPPPLPPLPQGYSQRAATAIAKLAPPWLTSHHSRSSSPQRLMGHTAPEDDSAPTRPGTIRYRSHVQRSSSPASSRSAVHKTGIHIAALDVSPARTHAVLAGRKILKTVRVESSGSATEDVNIRTSIIAYANAHSKTRGALGARHQDQLAANDVRWSNGRFDSYIATAATSGRIVIYDLNRAGLEVNTLSEHTRQVHKLAFNPFSGELLLSGSQDGGIKLWDLRNATATRRSQNTFNAHDQGIRDVKWSTRDGVEFATATEGGVVQRWDMRKQNAPIIKLKAHDKTCHSIDYHPGGKHLASGGADMVVKVWDTTRSDKRQNPTWSVHTPQSVLSLRWRPCAHTRNNDGELVPGPSAQIATTYDHDPRIHVWDFRRPNLPFQEIDRYDVSATDILWHSEDLLWSVGSVGVFTQTDLSHVPKPVERLSVNSLSIAPDSSFVMFSNPRSVRQRSLPDAQGDFLQRTNTNGSSGERFGSSVSANEGSFDEGSLLASTIRRRRKKAASDRLLAGASRNSEDAAFGQIETPLNLEPIIETTQTGIHGNMRGVFDAKAFQYLAEHYEPPEEFSKCSDFDTIAKHLEKLFLRNSSHAVHAGDHGLAHIWRILAWAVKKELDDWSKDPESKQPKHELHKRPREHSDAATATDMMRTVSVSTARDHTHLRSPLSLIAHESGSNVPTPRVRPSTGHSQVPMLPPGSLGDDPVETSRKHEHDMSQLLPPNVTELRDSDRTTLLERVPHIKFEDRLPAPDKSTSQITTPGPRPIPGSSHVKIEEASASLEQHLKDSDSSPSFSDFEEQLAAKRAALSEYRHTPRPVLKFGDTTGGLLGATFPSSPSRGVDVPRPGLNRYDSGESFNMLSESAGSYQTSLPMSSFDESPVKRNQVGSLPESRSIEQEIEDRLLVPELGKQAAAEEGERLLKEVTGSGVFPDPPALTDEDGPDASVEQQDVVGEARRPSWTPPILHKKETDTDASVGVEADHNVSHALCKLPCNDEYFKHAIALPHSDPKPWHASTFLAALLAHYLSHLSFIQLPTMLALYLHPIYPNLFPTHRYVSSALSVSEVKSDPNSLTVSHLTTVLLSYHAQLVSLRHYIPATELRRNCAPNFPEVSRKATPGSVGGYWCRTCQKPSKGKTKGECSRCTKDWGGCMICGELRLRHKKWKQIKGNAAQTHGEQGVGQEKSRESAGVHPPLPLRSHSRPKMSSRSASRAHTSAPETKKTDCYSQSHSQPSRPKGRGARWTYCSTCAHGGHASCLSAWFTSPVSRGACAVAGCTHACAPGSLREEQRAQRARERAELTQLRRGTGVLRDERTVRESMAVREARGSNATGSEGVGILGGSSGVGVVGVSGLGIAGPAGIPMESVREAGMLEGERLGIGMGRGRGRWRNAGAPIGGGGGGGRALNRTGGRNSTGSAASIRPADSAEGSTEGSSVSVREYGPSGAGGGILGAVGATRGLRRVRLMEPGDAGEEGAGIRVTDVKGKGSERGRGMYVRDDDRDGELAIEFAEGTEVSTASSSVP